ncbi:unnamed protein product [Effrenium voratum]|uniref:Uncharacterized protein n=1 Tax=Effrenium voratum TaxID=2562239 RepID=A0AA36IZX7_9DINO|nr:unnamed protein product [Effrenium voratum]CAJ1396701.1 unnamed protein product [Effrenium voratum]CAJ1459270.1 unnamed protein product [Effrenium voratum]
MGGAISKIGKAKKLSNLLSGRSKKDRDKFDRAFAKYPPTPSRTWGFQANTNAIYANDSWASTQKRIRMSDINRFLGMKPYPGKPSQGVIHPGWYNLVWGNPEEHWWSDAEDQNYNLQFSKQQHHDMGPKGVLIALACTALAAGARASRAHRNRKQIGWGKFL